METKEGIVVEDVLRDLNKNPTLVVIGWGNIRSQFIKEGSKLNEISRGLLPGLRYSPDRMEYPKKIYARIIKMSYGIFKERRKKK